jgi:hypothetical protein
MQQFAAAALGRGKMYTRAGDLFDAALSAGLILHGVCAYKL